VDRSTVALGHGGGGQFDNGLDADPPPALDQFDDRDDRNRQDEREAAVGAEAFDGGYGEWGRETGQETDEVRPGHRDPGALATERGQAVVDPGGIVRHRSPSTPSRPASRQRSAPTR
jgi:hypothetical protein